MLRPLPLALAASGARRSPQPKGHLVVVGGGGVPDVDPDDARIELAGGPAAPIVVFPQASELADTGDVAVEMWKKAGATNVRWLPLTDAAAARQAVESAAFIWFPGGDQVKLMKAFEGTGVPEVIARRYRDGAVVGGTSAGAAVMSAVMLTGDADLQSITVGATKTAPGLGLWPEVIVDQHHLKRQRQSRLISLVLEHPTLVGVGIDERTAAIVSGSRFEVLGESTVLVIDARRAKVEPRAAGPALGRAGHHAARADGRDGDGDQGLGIGARDSGARDSGLGRGQGCGGCHVRRRCCEASTSAGAKRVAMADLRALVERLGYRDVRTILNSGNVVFTGPPRIRATGGEPGRTGTGEAPRGDRQGHRVDRPGARGRRCCESAGRDRLGSLAPRPCGAVERQGPGSLKPLLETGLGTGGARGRTARRLLLVPGRVRREPGCRGRPPGLRRIGDDAELGDGREARGTVSATLRI